MTDILKEAGLIDTAFMTEYHRDRGSAVHLAIALLNEDDLDEGSLDEDVARYMPAYKAFIREVKPEIEQSEVAVENKALGYCGTADSIIRIRGRRGALDHKCGGPSPWHQLQLAGYTGCFPDPLARWNLYLRPDGNYRLIEHTGRQDWTVFKAALLLSQWRKANP